MIDQNELKMMALIGWEQKLIEITQRIQEIQNRIKIISIADGIIPLEKKRRKMSAQARANMRAGQKKRWAAYHKLQKIA